MIDDDIFRTVEHTANTLHVTVTAFMQSALRHAVQQQNCRELEGKHRQGYLANPIEPDEFSVWEEEQAWGD